MKGFLVALALLLVAPAAAHAGVSMTAREVTLHGGRVLAASPPSRFDLLGLHWRGSGGVLFSTRSATGRWTAWHAADADQYPDAGSPENRLRGWHLGGLVWTGPSTAVRFRTRGQVTRLRAYYVESTAERVPMRTLSLAGSPQIITRAAWGANEAIRKEVPQYADAVHFAVIHHTAGSNDYTAAESAAIVRGIELYHVQGNGWNDIGYNFLVDKYGQVFEGRYGGVDRPVVGAHAQGFNTGSVGIAVLGEYGSATISDAARAALVNLLAWRLDIAHVDPLSTLDWASGGNARFPAKVPVRLRAISGHRDTGFTDCPGNAFYAQLPEIAREVAAAGGPKLYAPKATGTLGGLVRFTGTLSGETPWTVTVTGSSGTPLVQQSGTGPTLDWTWDSSTAPPDRYTWSISGPSMLGATGTLGTKVAAVALSGVTATPDLIAPGGAGTTVAYTLAQPATVTATLVDATGAPVSTLWSDSKPAGVQTFTFAPDASLAAGSYTIAIAAVTAAGTTASVSVPVTVDPTLISVTAGPAIVSLAGGATAGVAFTLASGPDQVQLDVKLGDEVVATPFSGSLDAGPQSLSWDGKLADGTPAPDGAYSLVLTLTDAVTTIVRTVPVTLDSTPPVVTPVSAKAMRFTVSEPVTAVLGVGTHHYVLHVDKAGPFH
ncbi:MAG TPA: FlgD immunoglobulin-like domain containing protein, partial [Gaiellaceae bacterium]|nr:FlgD immunoglobulin-like domain containing protein [Gaiellaceae bacterium]